MKRILVSLTIVAALLATAAAVVNAGSGQASTAPAAKHHSSMTVFLPGTKTTYVDTGAKGYSPGDYFLAHGAVFNHSGGTRIGGLSGIWTLLSPAADSASIMFHLPKGTVYVDGKIHHDAPQSVLRLAGGTGAYKSAHGTAVFKYVTETTASIKFNVVS